MMSARDTDMTEKITDNRLSKLSMTCSMLHFKLSAPCIRIQNDKLMSFISSASQVAEILYLCAQ